MAKRDAVTSFLDTYLDITSIPDDSWNGLQVEGKSEVRKIMFTTDAGLATFEKALEVQADMLVVHHGMFWRPGDPRIQGYMKRRISLLLENGISLYAAHLPLDKHPEVGNNAQLIKILGFEQDQPFALYNGQNISFTGKIDKPKTLEELVDTLVTSTGATCKTLPFGKKEIRTIAVCSGGGSFPQFIEAVNAGVDAYITGDATEIYHMAKDMGLNVIFAGHHATEIVGVKALAEVVKKELSVDVEFVDVPTGL